MGQALTRVLGAGGVKQRLVGQGGLCAARQGSPLNVGHNGKGWVFVVIR